MSVPFLAGAAAARAGADAGRPHDGLAAAVLALAIADAEAGSAEARAWLAREDRMGGMAWADCFVSGRESAGDLLREMLAGWRREEERWRRRTGRRLSYEAER